MNRGKLLPKYLRKILLSFAVACIILSFFVIRGYRVSSDLMQRAISKGDYIAVNKLSYGVRIPITWFSFPFKWRKHYSRIIEFPYFRLPALAHIKRNDILLFNNPKESDPPIDKKSEILARVVALPGDTLRIENKRVFINTVVQENPETCEFIFRVTSSGIELNKEFLDQYNIRGALKIGNLPVYDLYSTQKMADSLLKNEQIKHVRELSEINNSMSYVIFPHDQSFIWNKDFFGSLVIPKKNQTIALNLNYLPLYRRIIESYEKNDLVVENGKIFINGKEAVFYTFKQDYFFVLSDNRDKPDDSRKWGFLPESHIIGKLFNQ